MHVNCSLCFLSTLFSAARLLELGHTHTNVFIHKDRSGKPTTSAPWSIFEQTSTFGHPGYNDSRSSLKIATCDVFFISASLKEIDSRRCLLIITSCQVVHRGNGFSPFITPPLRPISLTSLTSPILFQPTLTQKSLLNNSCVSFLPPVDNSSHFRGGS